MSKKDKVLAQITWFQVVFVTLIMTEAFLARWFITAEKPYQIMVFAAASLAGIIAIGIVYLGRSIMRKIDMLDTL